MKYNSTKIILILIFIIIILGCIFIFKILNEKNDGGQNIGKSSYSKSELIDLIKSENNKTNYEVEYTVNDTKYNRKYLNKKMRWEVSTNEKNIISYLDFEKNTNTIINEENKIVIIQKISLINENYMPEDILEII